MDPSGEREVQGEDPPGEKIGTERERARERERERERARERERRISPLRCTCTLGHLERGAISKVNIFFAWYKIGGLLVDGLCTLVPAGEPFEFISQTVFID